MAARIIEDRALKTRQFFNTIAEHWDTLTAKCSAGSTSPGPCATRCPKDATYSVIWMGCGTDRWNGCAGAPGRSSVDGSPRMLEPAAPCRGGREPEGVSLRIGELSHLPLQDCEADFASINMVLHHLSNPENALAEIRRAAFRRAARGGGF